MRFLFLSWIFTFVLMANMDLYPKTECELYNNLKHTKNRGHQVLRLDRTYEMLKHHKGQYLLKVENATPVQRWVDDDCLTLRPLRSSPLYGNTVVPKVTKSTEKKSVKTKYKDIKTETYKKKYYDSKASSKQNLLALSWHNAFCETHRYKKECKRGLSSLLKRKASEEQFVLHGLWPQPRTNVYCLKDRTMINKDKNKRWRSLPSIGLSNSIKDALVKVMPGFKSQLHKHEWIKHGTCYGTDANKYYGDAVNFIKQVNNSDIGKLFKKNIGKTITLKQVRTAADKSFGIGAGNRIELQCRRGLITELWLHIGSGEDDLTSLLAKGKKVRSRCKKGRIDRAGFR